jgi:transposase InsO family protein
MSLSSWMRSAARLSAGLWKASPRGTSHFGADDGHHCKSTERGALIHHSDRGVQYACTEYTEILAAYDIQPSMSRVGNPYELHESPEAGRDQSSALIR